MMEPIYAVAEPGDTVWSLTKRSLAIRLGRTPTNEEVANAVARAEVPSGDLNLIRPGEVIVLGVPEVTVREEEAARAGARGAGPTDRAAVLREAARGVRPQPAPAPPQSNAPDSFVESQQSPAAAESAGRNTSYARRVLEEMMDPFRVGVPNVPSNPFTRIGEALGRM